MPRIVRADADIKAAIAKQMAEPTKININGIEYTFIADDIIVFCDNPSQIADIIDVQIERPIITVGDYGYVKYVMSPKSDCRKAVGISGDMITPFNYFCVKYCAPTSSISSALNTICGVVVDKYDAIVSLPAGTSIISIVDGRAMHITETDFAPEMIGIDTLSYYIGIAGIAKYNGAIAIRMNEENSHNSFHIRLEMRNEFMFASIMDPGTKYQNMYQKKIFTGSIAQLVGVELSSCNCPYKYGPVYACYNKYNKEKDRTPYYNIRCVNCVEFRHTTIVEIETSKTIQDAIDEYCADIDTENKTERIEMLRDLVGGELIRWRGELCLRGKKWFYHPVVFSALARGIARDFPGYYWI